jgi:hypothetical protein
MFVFNDFEALTASACYELSGRRQLKVIQRANCGFLVFHFVLNEALLDSHFPNCAYFSWNKLLVGSILYLALVLHISNIKKSIDRNFC